MAGIEQEASALREVPTIAGTFLAYGALFFDRLAPLYLVALIADDLPVSRAGQGALALTIGLGWAGSMILARWAAGRWGNRRRILAAAAGVALLGAASAIVSGWTAFVILRGLGGLLAGTAAPAVTALSFAAAPVRRRGLDLGIVQSSTRLLGSLVSPAVVTAVAAAYDWRVALLTSSGFVLVGAIALTLLVPADPQPADNTATSAAPILHPGGRRNILLCTASSAVLLTWLIVVSQGTGPLLQGWLSLGVAEAGRLLSLFGVGAWLATLIVPLASDRLGRRMALAASSLIGGAAGLGVAIAANDSAGGPLIAAALMILSGVAMGGLPLVISIIPAEAVASGDVGRAVTAPIVGAELIGGAVLPAVAFAVAGQVGLPAILGTAAVLLLLVAALSFGLRPPHLLPTDYDDAGSGPPRSPGFDVECARWLAEESSLTGIGVETVGIDAGAAGDFEPPFPLHYYLLGAGKYGVTQLANLASLPPSGALLVVAPLKLVGGTGSPVRALALVPRG